MEIKKVKLSALKLNDGNPRIIKDFKFQKLVKSILTFPEMLQLREIVTDEAMMVLGGNMRLRALQHIAQMTEQEIRQQLKQYDKEDLEDYWMAWHDNPMENVKIARGLNDEQKKEFIAKDNVAYGEWDWDMLAKEWNIEDLKDWGVDLPIDWGNEIESENADLNAEEDDFDEDKDAVEPICQRGDIWMLGQHTLMCGDSTSEEDITNLMGGDMSVDLVFTDPPYGMNAVSKSGVLSKKYKKDILNDNDNNVAKASFNLCQDIFGKAKHIWWGANYYTECLPSAECWIVWDKDNGGSDQTDCELAWSNLRSVVRQFTMVSEKFNRVHPTQKPLKLLHQIFAKFDKKQNWAKVLDVFGGSGTTLIACEQLDRKCYMMELDPHYCDVIIARWEKLTGNKAIKKQ